MANDPSVVQYLSVTIAATAGSILALADGGAVTMTGAMHSFVGTLETATVRARGDGTAPTATEGELVAIAANVYLAESEITKTQFIRTGATSGVLKGHIYNVPLASVLGGAR